MPGGGVCFFWFGGGEEVVDVFHLEAAVCEELGVGGVLGDVVGEGVDEGKGAEELGDGDGGECLVCLFDVFVVVSGWSEV